MKPSEPDDLPEVHLQDVTEDETEVVAPPTKARKKKWLMLGGLVTLLLVTAVGGYFLLRGNEVNVKAVRKTPERVTNGSDLQQAAYDSLRGSLSSPPAPTATQSPAANIGSNQPTTIAMAGVTPSPSASPSAAPKAAAPIQSGIAMTIAPPPEVMATQAQAKPTMSVSSSTTGSAENSAVTANTNAVTGGKPRTDASIVFASLPMSQTEKNKNPATAYHDSPQPLPPPTPVLPEKSLRALPSFGAMLPVRLLGMLYTLRPGTLARLELLRDSKTEHWQLPRGTIFVGAVQGAGRDRAYVQIKGFIDPTTERFIKLEGEALGSDGGAGLRGKERRLSSVWLRVLDRAAQTGTQLLTGLLGRKGSQVIIAADPAGMYRSAMGNESAQLQNNRSFVEVAAGTVGFVLVTTLPTAAYADAPVAANHNTTSPSLSDAELAELLSSSDSTKIRAALPRLTPEVRRVVEQSLKEMEH